MRQDRHAAAGEGITGGTWFDGEVRKRSRDARNKTPQMCGYIAVCDA
jgi:hypothetical protein